MRDGNWLATADDGVYAFGDAPPVRGREAVLRGVGYWLVASDDAVFHLR